MHTVRIWLAFPPAHIIPPLTAYASHHFLIFHSLAHLPQNWCVITHDPAIQCAIIRDYRLHRPRKGRIKKANRRRCPLDDGATLELVDETITSPTAFAKMGHIRLDEGDFQLLHG